VIRNRSRRSATPANKRERPLAELIGGKAAAALGGAPHFTKTLVGTGPSMASR
jgi:hypothetical protein